jgi:hypothetical protein
VLETAEQICETPLRWPVEDDGYRRWRLLVFPYALRYDIAADGNIDIVAVAHAKRAPGNFRGRNQVAASQLGVEPCAQGRQAPM